MKDIEISEKEMASLIDNYIKSKNTDNIKDKIVDLYYALDNIEHREMLDFPTRCEMDALIKRCNVILNTTLD